MSITELDIQSFYHPELKITGMLLKLQEAQSMELENMRKNERTISIAAQNVHYILEGTVERIPAVHREGQQII